MGPRRGGHAYDVLEEDESGLHVARESRSFTWQGDGRGFGHADEFDEVEFVKLNRDTMSRQACRRSTLRDPWSGPTRQKRISIPAFLRRGKSAHRERVRPLSGRIFGDRRNEECSRTVPRFFRRKAAL